MPGRGGWIASIPTRFLCPEGGARIAVRERSGRGPAVVFLPGFNSVMKSRKGDALDQLCARLGHRYVRFDYRGHGDSGGRLKDGGVEQWLADAEAVIEHCVPGDVVLVGSSMGGWIMLLLARTLGRRVKGLVGVAAAADFTRHIEAGLLPTQREELDRDGLTHRWSRYGDGPYPLTRRMIDEGERNHVLGAGLTLACPLHLFHGSDDPDLGWESALDILNGVEGPEARFTLVQHGDHRLSRAVDLDEICAVVERMLARAAPPG